MKKLTENFAAKITAVILILLLGTVCAFTAIGTALAAEQGHYTSGDTDFYNTTFCSDQAYNDYVVVTDYFDRLLELHAAQALEQYSAALAEAEEKTDTSSRAGTSGAEASVPATSVSEGAASGGTTTEEEDTAGEAASGATDSTSTEAGMAEKIPVPTPASLIQDATEGSFDRISGLEDSYLNYYQKILTSDNFKYTVKSTSGKLLFGTYAGEEYGYNASYSYQGSLYYSDLYSDLYSNLYSKLYDQYNYIDSATSGAGLSYNDLSYSIVINYYVLNPITSGDNYYAYYQFDNFLNQNRMLMPVLFAVCAFLCLILLIFLLCAAGHRAGQKGIVPNLLDKVPFDLYLAVMIVLFVLCAALALDDYYQITGIYAYALAVLGLVGCGVILLMTLLTTATRIKLGSLFRNTLICRFGGGILRLLKKIPLFWKGALATVGVIFVELVFVILFHYESSFLFVMWWLGFHALFFLAALYLLKTLKQLQKSGEMLAEGNFEYKTDTSSLRGDFKKHAENLNSVSVGMTKAVEARMKSERLKTELITNVSHDIKTPLTSIINYVDLLKKEEIGSETANAYLEVLERQSARLKKLIEDLVEASKASTGNISVRLAKTRVAELINQSAAEYEDRFAAAGLEPIIDCEEGLLVWADGRLLWRVLDNLFGNICKYALSGTRVYITARMGDNNRVEIILKNISRQKLGVQPEELMERFVRGDSSRSTEGSGLGLSIARSLTELQRGTFSIDIDGDLFKATLLLFAAPAEEEKPADPA